MMKLRKMMNRLVPLVVLLVATSVAQGALTHHWDFDEGIGTTAVDLAGSNDGAIGGATWGSDATRSSFLEFDGANDFVDPALLLPQWSGLNAESWSVWLRADAGNFNDIVLGNRLDGQTTAGGRLFAKFTIRDSGRFVFNDGAPAPISFDSASPGYTGDYLPETWVHVASIRDGQDWTFYVNGNLVNTVPLSIPNLPTAALPFFIGGEANQSDANEFFNGGLDDVRIYDHALSALEVAALAEVDPPELVLPGDFNGDNVVDNLDFDVWQTGLGTTYVWGDFEVWQLHLGQSLPSGAQSFDPPESASVPEPSAIVILAGCLAMLVCAQSRRSGADEQAASRFRMPQLLLNKAFLVVAAFSGVMSTSTVVNAAEKPNIVMIVSDDHHWRDYSYTGENDYVQTPNLDELATDGVMFNRGYVPMSLCRASLVTMLTGLYAVQHGTTGNDPNTRTDADPLGLDQAYPNSVDNRIMRRNIQHEATLPRMLAEVGYVSQHTGKLWEGDYHRAGFDEGFVNDGDRHQDTIAIGRGGSGKISDVSEVTDFIDQSVANDDPFFAFYAPLLPHTPHNPPAALRSRYDTFVNAGDISTHEANYYAMVDWLDHSVGEIRSHIRGATDANGGSVDDNTIYVYVADNGWSQSATGQGEGGDGKRTATEAGIRTPIMISWKDQIFDARTLEQKLADTTLASSVDIATTLLSIVGLTPREKMEGVNLLTQRRGKAFGDIFDHDQNIYVNGEYRVGSKDDTLNWRWMIEDQWKLILPKTGSPELYDVLSDPDELNNLASSQPSRVTQMSQEIEAWWATKTPTTLYDHEFNGNSVSIDAQAPDVIDSSLPAANWSVGPQAIQDNGTIFGRSTAVLPFVPEEDKLYELRTGLSPVATDNSLDWLSFGFQETEDATADPADHGVAWVRVRRDASLDDLVLHASADGDPDWNAQPFSTDEVPYYNGIVPLTLVLDTRDNDPTLPGSQWAVELIIDGSSKQKFIFTDGNPDIEGIALGSFSLPGDPSVAGFIDYFQLLEIPTETYSVVELLAGDYNQDGTVDAADYTVWRDNVGAPAGTLPNDPNGGTIGEDQYATWRDNYGASSQTPSIATAESATVPEPGSLALVVMLLCGMVTISPRSTATYL